MTSAENCVMLNPGPRSILRRTTMTPFEGTIMAYLAGEGAATYFAQEPTRSSRLSPRRDWWPCAVNVTKTKPEGLFADELALLQPTPALDTLAPLGQPPRRIKADDPVLAFLATL